MKVICTVKNIRDAVLAAERFSGRHITLAILSHALITADNKKISIIATNLETGIEYTVPGRVVNAGSATASAKALSQILQSLTEDTVTIDAGKNQLALHTTTSESALHSLNAEEFPNLPAIKQEHTFSIAASALIPALQAVLPAAATTDLKPQLTGILFTTATGTLTLAATDSFRLAERKLNHQDGVRDAAECIVPLRTAQEVIRTLPADGDITVLIGEHQVVFQSGDIRILSRLIDGAYPPYRNIIPKSFETHLVVDRAALLRSIRLAAVFSSRLNDVTCTFSPTEIEVSTANAEAGSSAVRVDAKGTGKAGSVMFNYRYLSDGLEAAPGEYVTLQLNGMSGAAQIQSPNDPSFLYLLMPIRSV